MREHQIPSIDERDYQEEHEEILSNPEFGSSEEAREDQLKLAKSWARYLNYSGWGYAAFAFFWAEPYDLVIVLGLLIPFVCLGTIVYFKGLIRLNQYENSAYPAVYAGVIIPICVLFLRASMDFEIYDYGPLWGPTIALGMVVALFMLWATQSLKIKDWIHLLAWLGAIVLGIAFAFGSIICINCYYDSNPPGETHYSEVVDMHTSSGKRTSYYIKFAPGGPFPEGDQVSVSSGTYESVQVGDQIEISMRSGLLGVPWYRFRFHLQD